MSDNAKAIKKEVVRVSKIMEAKGLVNALEGNLSIIDRETGRLYITPSGCRKEFLEEDMIAVMDGDEQIGGDYKRSSEYLLHKIALEVRSDCNAAAHIHPPYLTAFAFCGQSIKLRCSTTFALMAGDEIPCLPYGQPGTEHIADGLAEAIKDHDIVLLENHGLICVDKTLDHACAIVEALDGIMKIYSITQQLGMKTSDISEEEYQKIIGVGKLTNK